MFHRVLFKLGLRPNVELTKPDKQKFVILVNKSTINVIIYFRIYCWLTVMCSSCSCYNLMCSVDILKSKYETRT